MQQACFSYELLRCQRAVPWQGLWDVWACWGMIHVLALAGFYNGAAWGAHSGSACAGADDSGVACQGMPSSRLSLMQGQLRA